MKKKLILIIVFPLVFLKTKCSKKQYKSFTNEFYGPDKFYLNPYYENMYTQGKINELPKKSFFKNLFSSKEDNDKENINSLILKINQNKILDKKDLKSINNFIKNKNIYDALLLSDINQLESLAGKIIDSNYEKFKSRDKKNELKKLEELLYTLKVLDTEFIDSVLEKDENEISQNNNIMEKLLKTIFPRLHFYNDQELIRKSNEIINRLNSRYIMTIEKAKKFYKDTNDLKIDNEIYDFMANKIDYLKKLQYKDINSYTNNDVNEIREYLINKNFYNKFISVETQKRELSDFFENYETQEIQEFAEIEKAKEKEKSDIRLSKIIGLYGY